MSTPSYRAEKQLLINRFIDKSAVSEVKCSICSNFPDKAIQSPCCDTVLPRLSVPQLSETSIIRTQFRTWSLCKKLVFSLKSQTLRLSRVHVFVCHTYMFNVRTQWYVIVYRVKCNGLQMRPSYIFSCYNSMYIARKVSFRLSEQFHLSEQPIKPLCPKVFG